MGLPVFFVGTEVLSGPDSGIRIEGKDARHLSRSLRVRVGEGVTICDGKGLVCQGRVTQKDGDFVELDVLERSWVEPSVPRIELYQALIRSSEMVENIRLGVEVGVDEVFPFACRRSEAYPRNRFERRLGRWNAVVAESAKVSRRYMLPQVHEPLSWGGLLDTIGTKKVSWVLWERETGRDISRVLTKEPPPHLALIIGPRGGFEQGEIDELIRAGARSISLGSFNFRSQTAGPLVAFYVRQHFGDPPGVKKHSVK